MGFLSQEKMIQDLINNHYCSLKTGMDVKKCVSSVYRVEWIQHVLYRTCVSCDLLLHRFFFSFSCFFSPLYTHFFVSLTIFYFIANYLSPFHFVSLETISNRTSIVFGLALSTCLDAGFYQTPLVVALVLSLRAN